MEKIDVANLELNPFESILKDNFLITAEKDGKWNTMTAGWGGMGAMWGKPCVFVFVRESRLTLEYLNASDSFTLSFFPPEKKDILAYCGSHSGRDVDKAKETGLTAVDIDGAVGFEEANLTFVLKKMSCHLIDSNGILSPSTKERWYPKGDWHYMFVGEIQGAYVPDTDITVVEGEII